MTSNDGQLVGAGKLPKVTTNRHVDKSFRNMQGRIKIIEIDILVGSSMQSEAITAENAANPRQPKAMPDGPPWAGRDEKQSERRSNL